MGVKSFVLKVYFIILFIFLFTVKGSPQSYNFSNYSLKEGLPQSQVNVIYQAKDRTLWLGTFGGISNFDGQKFTSYSKADGLASNSITSVAEDNSGQIFIGTEAGLNIFKNGKISSLLKGKEIYQLLSDKHGSIWGLTDGKLFRLEHGQQHFIPIENSGITTLATDAAGNLYASVWNKGIYKQQGNQWILYKSFPPDLAKAYINKILFDKLNTGKLFILSSKQGVYTAEKKGFISYFINKQINYYHSVEQDSKGNIWVGTESGAYLVGAKKEFLKFNSSNGLSDNRVDEIFCDVENNIWVSCFSKGIFKYKGDAFIRYNKFKGKDFAYAVSGIGADRNQNLWIGTFNKGLLKYDGKDVESVNIPELRNRNIYFVYTDSKKNNWISAEDQGIWKYDGRKFSQFVKPGKFNFNAMAEDKDGGIWLNSPMTCTYIKGDRKVELSGFEGMPSSIYSLTKDSILVGTSTGLVLVKNKQIDKHFKIKALAGTYILAIIKHGDYLIFATLGDGMISWNVKTNLFKRYVIADGLNSNDIYSLSLDNNNNLWLGTGRGINKLTFNKGLNKYDVLNDDPLIIECNQNAILYYKNNILVGTINGLIRCKTDLPIENMLSPQISIKQVTFFHKEDPTQDSTLVLGLENKADIYRLNANQDHLSISFKAVYLTNPQAVSYQYKLIGVDADFGKAMITNEVEYSALGPGNYVFEVFAIVNGKKSATATFSFYISPPFYDTIWFKTIALLAIIFLIWLVFYLVFKARERKKQKVEKIKLTEQAKIRTQTAEDFHDDIGNKLTRINVLSEILDKKVDVAQTEEKELIRLIRENAGLLYSGTKDILWALDPQSDNLFEILQHIKNFGVDLFQNTGVGFKMDGILTEYRHLKLSMEFNRNLTLIFKEMLNNVLKHAQAKNLLVMVLKTESNTITILTIDDGQGFNLASVQRGRGLTNIETRCKRIKSTFNISSAEGKGTTIAVATKIAVT